MRRYFEMCGEKTVLFIDDEPRRIERLLAGTSYRAVRTYDMKGTREYIESVKGTGAMPFIAFVDIVLPEVIAEDEATEVAMNHRGGLELMRELRAANPEIKLVPMTARGWGTEDETRRNVLDEAAEIGILGNLTKPLEEEELGKEMLRLIKNALPRKPGLGEAGSVEKKYRVDISRGGARYIVGASKGLQDGVISKIQVVAPYRSTVLIVGESGTGKELVARAIHAASNRVGKFYSINCAAIHENLIESELFGHEKGAFTGADSAHKGKFELADKGTLFLDEVGDMSQAAQAKVLRVLQEGEFERVGGTETIKADVRVVAATNRQLEQLIDEGKFRKELYYRLKVTPISIPPLRERKEDIPVLAHHFVNLLNSQYSRSKFLHEGVYGILERYHWPGNVRELENAIEYGYTNCFEDEILPEHLPAFVGGVKDAPSFTKALEAVAKELLDKDGVTLDMVLFLLAEKAAELSDTSITEVCKRLGLRANTLNKYRRSVEDMSKALIEAHFDEEKAAERLPDFSVDFLRKKMAAFMFGKSEDDFRKIAEANGYPQEWLEYLRKVRKRFMDQRGERMRQEGT